MNRFFTLLLAASCLTAVGQSEYCLDGTVWDEALGGCVPEVIACGVISDLDGDGAVGSSDLLSLLTDYGYVFPDVDSDGLCDEIDDCVGEYDECGVCNGPGAVYECGCEECAAFVECGDPISYQGYDYATVLIGEQCWFAENLRAETYLNGDTIPANLGEYDWFETNGGAVSTYGEGFNSCHPGFTDIDACDQDESLNRYGRLYNGYAVNDARGLCPSGWHVPMDEEWMIMEMALGMDEAEANELGLRGTDQANQMKTDYGWRDDFETAFLYAGTNSSGFSALPGGQRDLNGSFSWAGSSANWWSIPSNGGSMSRSLSYAINGVYRNDVGVDFTNGLSVRCIKDTE